MVSNPAESVSAMTHGGVFLPAISFGYLHIVTGATVTISAFGVSFSFAPYLIAFSTTIVAAAIFHEMLRSITGPSATSISDPFLSNSQKIWYMLVQSGSPHDYPENMYEVPEINISTFRKVMMIISVLSILTIVFSYPITLYLLTGIPFEQDLIAGGIFFLELAWVLRMTAETLWPPIYRYSNRELPSVRNNLTELSEYLVSKNAISDVNARYTPTSGGFVVLEYTIAEQTAQEERQTLETVIACFSAFCEKCDYPVSGLFVEVSEDEEAQAHYILEAEDIKESDTPVEDNLPPLTRSVTAVDNEDSTTT